MIHIQNELVRIVYQHFQMKRSNEFCLVIHRLVKLYLILTTKTDQRSGGPLAEEQVR